jgi:putative Holliday junction resolvase
MSDKNPPIPINDEDTDEIITLTDEDGTDHEFVLVDVLELNEREYAILLPFEGEESDKESDEEEMEAVILRVERSADGEEQLVEIEDEQEWQGVVDAYEAMLDEDDGEVDR